MLGDVPRENYFFNSLDHMGYKDLDIFISPGHPTELPSDADE